MYLLKWKGYSDEYNTWEPSSNLYCIDLLNAYKRKFNLTQRSKSQATEPKQNDNSNECDSTVPDVIASPSLCFSDSKFKYKHKTNHINVEHNSKKHSQSKAQTYLNGKRVCPTPNGQVQEAKKGCDKSCPVSNGLQSPHFPIEDKGMKEKPMTVKKCSRDYSKPVQRSKQTSPDKQRKDLRRRRKNNNFIVSIDLATLRHDNTLDTEAQTSDHGHFSNHHPIQAPASVSTRTDQCTFTAEHCLMCINHDHTYFIPPSSDSTRSPSTDLSEDYSSSSTVYGPLSPLCSPTCPALSISTMTSVVEVSPPHSPSEDSDSSVISISSEPSSKPNLCVNSDMKLYLSPSSSTDLDVCDLDDDSDHERFFQPNSTKHSLSQCMPEAIRSREVPKLDFSASDSTGNNIPRWRKGPMPLPRSFSKRYSSLSKLQTKAAKIQLPESTTNGHKARRVHLGVRKARSRHRKLSLRGALAPLVPNDTNSHSASQPTKAPLPVIKINLSERRLSYEYVSECAYKEHLMNWQYELNKQRDGTDDIIFVENEVDRVPPPLTFNYICSNIYRKGVPDPANPELSSSLCGCECYYLGRRCGPKSEYCCAHMAGSKFAYSPAGKVRVPPGTPIYECNPKCSCPSSCTNRIVQLGRKIPLCIFRTRGRGWGVKTMQPIKSNTFVSEYVGEVITNEEAERRGEMCDAQGITYLFDLDFEDDNSAFTIDAANYGNISHFFNHSVSYIFGCGCVYCSILP